MLFTLTCFFSRIREKATRLLVSNAEEGLETGNEEGEESTWRYTNESYMNELYESHYVRTTCILKS
jgi:hypothetical protein